MQKNRRSLGTSTPPTVEGESCAADFGSNSCNQRFPHQEEMQGLFGADFSDLAVSLGDPRADEIGAKAWYDGDELVFADVCPDRNLVARELVHVMQRDGGRSDQVQPADHPAEVESRELGDRAADGVPVQVHARRGPGIHREAVVDDPAASSVVLAKQGEPIVLRWHPEPLALTLGEGAIEVTLVLGLDLSFTPEPVDDQPDVYRVTTDMVGSAQAKTAGEWAGEGSFKGVSSGGRPLTRGAFVEGSASASAQGSARAVWRSVHVVQQQEFEDFRRAGDELRRVLRGLETAFVDAKGQVGDVQDFIAKLGDNVRSLQDAERALQTAGQHVDKAGAWVEQVRGLGEVYGELLQVAFELGERGAGAVDSVLASSEPARDLREGESLLIDLEASGALEAEGAVGASLGEHNLGATARMDRSDSWRRLFEVRPVDCDGRPGVAITVRFSRRERSGRRAGGSLDSTLSASRDALQEEREGHEMVVRLPKDLPKLKFDRIYRQVFTAMTPDELVRLTAEPGMVYDQEAGAGILTLSLDTQWLGESSTSLLAGSGDGDGLLNLGRQGDHRSQVVLDYEHGALLNEEVYASGRKTVGVSPFNNAMAKQGREALRSVLGVDPLANLPDVSLLDISNEWSYSRQLASFTGDWSDLSDALPGMRVLMGASDLRKLALRASGSRVKGGVWAACGTAGPPAFYQPWSDLGDALARVLAMGPAREVDVGPTRGVVRAKAVLDVLFRPPGGGAPVRSALQNVEPPAQAVAQWQTFLLADLVGAFVGWADPEFGADTVTRAILGVRDVYIDNALGLGERPNAQYHAVGVELDAGRELTFADGGEMTHRQLFTVLEPQTRAVVVDLAAATDAATEEQRAALERQLATGEALPSNPDGRLIDRGQAQLGELEHLLRTVDGWSSDDAKTKTEIPSITRFATDLHGDVGRALGAYWAVYSPQAQRQLRTTDDDALFEGLGVEGDRTEERAVASRTASRLARSMLTMVRSMEAADRGYQDAEGSDELWAWRDQVFNGLAHWLMLYDRFEQIYTMWPESAPLSHDDTIDADTWMEAVAHPRRDVLTVRHDPKSSLLGLRLSRYMRSVSEPKLTDDAELPPTQLISQAKLFDSGMPRPAAATKSRADYGGLTPQQLRDIGPDEGGWGLRAPLRDYLNELSDEITHALHYSPDQALGRVWVIEGHTDGDDTHLFNNYLGYRRAEAMRRGLVSRGVPAAMLSVRSYGETRPVEPNASDLGKDQNRRSERQVLSLPANEALFAENSGTASLALVPDESSEATPTLNRKDVTNNAFYEGTMSPSARDGLEQERAAYPEQERRSRVVRELYADAPHLLVGMRVAADLLGPGRAERALFGFGLRLDTLQERLIEQGLTFRLPIGDLSSGSSSVSLHPARLVRLDDNRMELRSRVFTVAGVPSSLFARSLGAPAADHVIDLHLAQTGVRGALDDGGDLAPSHTRTTDGLLIAQFVAQVEDQIRLFDALDQGTSAVRLELGRPSTRAASPRQELFDDAIVWRVQRGSVSRVNAPNERVPDPLVEEWVQHCWSSLKALRVPVQVGAVTHHLDLGRLCKTSSNASNGAVDGATFDMDRAFAAWMSGQGREVDPGDRALRGRFDRALVA